MTRSAQLNKLAKNMKHDGHVMKKVAAARTDSCFSVFALEISQTKWKNAQNANAQLNTTNLNCLSPNPFSKAMVSLRKPKLFFDKLTTKKNVQNLNK